MPPNAARAGTHEGLRGAPWTFPDPAFELFCFTKASFRGINDELQRFATPQTPGAVRFGESSHEGGTGSKTFILQRRFGADKQRVSA